MDDLTAFLSARLGQDEAAAKRGEEVFDAGWPDYPTYDSPELDDAYKYLDCFSPARMLRDVEAKRATLKLHAAEPGQHPDFCGHDMHELSCPTLRHLAAVYSDHPDYRPEWKP